MELNKLTFEPQPRTPHQVFDLTLLFVRRNFWSLFSLYLGLLIPIVLFGTLLFGVYYTSLLVWWLKPLLERPLLHYLANNSFGIQTKWQQSIKAITQLKLIDILKMLTIHRLSTNRAYLAPVEQLERQNTTQTTKRKNILKNRCDNKQFWWMILCVHIEFVITGVLVGAFFALFPDTMPINDQFSIEYFNNETFEQVYFIGYLIAISCIAPYFTTGGFLMYLNSRIKLEAWDIELSFKRIAAKFSQICIIGLISSLLFIQSQPAYAESNESFSEKIEKLEKQLNKTKKEEPEYQRTEQLNQIHQDVVNIYRENELINSQSTWVPKLKDNKDSQFDLTWLKNLFESLSFLTSLSSVIGYIFWALVISLVAWVIWKIVQIFMSNNSWSRQNRKVKSNPSETHVPDFISSENNKNKWPKDLLTASKQALEQSQTRYALALLLRHSILRISQQHPNLFHKSMTENECKLALIKVIKDEQKSSYHILFDTWIALAWAHKPVTSDTILSLIETFVSFEQLQGARSES